MADMTHAARARQWLDDPDNRVQEELAARLNASLAESTATREVTTAIVAQTREFTTRLHDIASALEPDAGLVRFTGSDHLAAGDYAVYVSPAEVAFLYEEPDDRTRIVSGGGAAVIVHGAIEDIAAKLGVSA